MDKKVIEARLKRLDYYISRLKRYSAVSKEEYIENQDYQDTVERNFQLAIQTCIDIANYIIAGKNLQVPEEEENVFIVLGKEGIMPRELSEKIKGMVGFRNILVHEYLTIDPNQVYAVLHTRLSDFNDFARAIVDFLESI